MGWRQEIGGRPIGNPPLKVGLLINGVAYAAIFVVVAFLISRFTSGFVRRSFLVLFLFVAAGLYIVFAVRAGEGILWVAGIAIFEAPDDEAMSAHLLEIGSSGNVRTTMLRAYDEEEMAGILRRIG